MFHWLTRLFHRREPQPCETCRWCIPDETFRGFMDDVYVMKYAKCIHPKKGEFDYCSTQREGLTPFGAWYLGWCGPQGRRWKPKEEK